MSGPVLYEVTDRIATITLHRPEARNALSRALLRELAARMAEADADDAVDVIILTGTDPAFSAGVDLKELGSRPVEESALAPMASADEPMRPWRPTTKPVIGAINGVAVTGGLEVALNCDFLVASERARFADTHSRVGVMPGWGLTVLLPQAVGIRRAREMSFTGNYVDAATALAWGLVNHVVPHDDLLATARALAGDICGNDQPGVRQIRATYDAVTSTTAADGARIEAHDSAAWMRRAFDPAEVERRRMRVVERGRSQQ